MKVQTASFDNAYWNARLGRYQQSNKQNQKVAHIPKIILHIAETIQNPYIGV